MAETALSEIIVEVEEEVEESLEVEKKVEEEVEQFSKVEEKKKREVMTKKMARRVNQLKLKEKMVMIM